MAKLAILILASFLIRSAQAADLGWVSRAVPTPGPIANPLDPSFAPTLTYSGPSWIWTADVDTKVFQSAGAIGSAQTIQMSGIRNETVGAQFFMQVPSTQTNVSVALSAITNTRTGETISTQSVSSAGQARLYVERYILITTMSVNSNWAGSGYFKTHVAGTNPTYQKIPDPLIPLRDPYYNQVTNAIPLSVSSGDNQGFYLSITIPQGISSGFYTFSVTITTSGQLVATIPGALEVFDSTMPVTATMPIYTGIDNTAMPTQAYGNGLTGANAYNSFCAGNDTTCQELIFHDAMVFGLDHRFQFTDLDAMSLTMTKLYNMFGHLMTGVQSSTYTNTLLPGARVAAVRAFLQGTNNATATTWVSTFTANFTTSTIMPFAQACDEPGSASGWGTCWRTLYALTPSSISLLVTANYNQMVSTGAQNYVTTLAMQVRDVPANKVNASTWAAVYSTRTIGDYDACDSGPCSGVGGTLFPNKHIDGFPIANRIHPWITYMDSMTYEFHSDATLCWITACGANASADPWATGGMLYSQSSHNTTASDGQGDETLMYPGTKAQVGVSTPIFIGSLRMELVMDGEQDTEYAKILTDAGQSGKFWTQVNGFIAGENSYNLDPYQSTGTFTTTLTAARQTMGCDIQRLKYPGGSCAW